MLDAPFVLAVSDFFVTRPDEADTGSSMQKLISSDIHLGQVRACKSRAELIKLIRGFRDHPRYTKQTPL